MNSAASSKTSKKGFGRKGDPRVNKAVRIKLEQPHLSLFDALQKGGFRYPCNHSSAIDSEGVSLGQRKNNLTRRLRQVRNEQAKASSKRLENNSGFCPDLIVMEPPTRSLTTSTSAALSQVDQMMMPFKRLTEEEDDPLGETPPHSESRRSMAPETLPFSFKDHLLLPNPEQDPHVVGCINDKAGDCSAYNTSRDQSHHSVSDIELFLQIFGSPSQHPVHQQVTNKGHLQQEEPITMRQEPQGSEAEDIQAPSAAHQEPYCCSKSGPTVDTSIPNKPKRYFADAFGEKAKHTEESSFRSRGERQSFPNGSFKRFRSDKFLHSAGDGLITCSSFSLSDFPPKVGPLQEDGTTSGSVVDELQHRPDDRSKDAVVVAGKQQRKNPMEDCDDTVDYISEKQVSKQHEASFFRERMSSMPDALKMQMALDLYLSEAHALYRKSMLMAGYPVLETKESSASNLAFAVSAWIAEGERLHSSARSISEEKGLPPCYSNNVQQLILD